MDSGSVFNGYYGFVFQGIWNLTQALSDINIDLGVDLKLSSSLADKDLDNKKILVTNKNSEEWIAFDDLILATDPLTAHSIIADFDKDQFFSENELTGSSGKMNLFFSSPIQWKDGTTHADSDSAFRFIFSVDTLDAFESASQQILDDGVQYAPGFMQIYCEGAADRRIDSSIQHDRIAVFFKNLSLASNGKDLELVEKELKQQLFQYIENPQDCFWSKLSTPKDLKEMFYFPSGNIDQTMLTSNQTYFDRTFSSNPSENFYGFLDYEHVYYCGAAAYPCGSIAGTPGYMCSQQIMRN
jgi:phytoene dehydrogenase-like protein